MNDGSGWHMVSSECAWSVQNAPCFVLSLRVMSRGNHGWRSTAGLKGSELLWGDMMWFDIGLNWSVVIWAGVGWSELVCRNPNWSDNDLSWPEPIWADLRWSDLIWGDLSWSENNLSWSELMGWSAVIWADVRCVSPDLVWFELIWQLTNFSEVLCWSELIWDYLRWSEMVGVIQVDMTMMWSDLCWSGLIWGDPRWSQVIWGDLRWSELFWQYSEVIWDDVLIWSDLTWFGVYLNWFDVILIELTIIWVFEGALLIRADLSWSCVMWADVTRRDGFPLWE